jgi:hypothetical protein
VRVDITSSTGQTLVSNTNILGNATGTVGYDDFTYDFTATTTTTTLRFTHAFAPDVTIREARIDNVRVTDLSAPPSLSMGLFPGVYIAGQIGLNYELQYSDPSEPSTWHSAGTFLLDASPKLVLVETNLVSPQRTFRAIVSL